jgi:hypothetical protein
MHQASSVLLLSLLFLRPALTLNTDSGYIMVLKDEAEEADIDQSRHEYVDTPDLSLEGYPVLPEAIYEMHCVNTVYRNLYYNIEHTRANCHPPNCEPPEVESWRIQHIGRCQSNLNPLQTASSICQGVCNYPG